MVLGKLARFCLYIEDGGKPGGKDEYTVYKLVCAFVVVVGRFLVYVSLVFVPERAAGGLIRPRRCSCCRCLFSGFGAM